MIKTEGTQLNELGVLLEKYKKSQEENQNKDKIIELLKRSNEFYADKNNWLYTGYNEGIHNLVDRHKTIRSIDLEKDNEWLEFAGKLAREVKKQVEELEK
jgi:hypothetical protein